MTKTERLEIEKAIRDISNDWSYCDEETGDECKGNKCLRGEHRAVCRLENLIRAARPD